MMKTTVNQRFEIMISALGMSKNAFAKSLGIASTQVYNIINGRNAPSFDLLSKIATRYPTVNVNWLLVERGSVLHPSSDDHQDSEDLMKKIKILEGQMANLTKIIGERQEFAYAVTKKKSQQR